MVREDPLWQDGNDYPARLDRQFIEDVFDVEGVLAPSGGALLGAPRAAGANMSVDVAAGRAVVKGDDEANQGCYRIISTAVENLPIGAAPGSDSRIDLVVARVRDANVTGGVSSDWILEVIPGAVAAVPVAPAVPNTAIPLAQVLVAAGTASITAGEITDLRTAAGSTLFLTEAAASAAFLPITGKAADSELLDGLNSTAFQTRDEKGSANGYASLGADGLVPLAQLPPAAGSVQTRVKTATTSRSSTIILAADPDLSVTVEASTRYRVRALLYMNAGSAPDLKWQFQNSGGPVTGRAYYRFHETGSAVITPALVDLSVVKIESAKGGVVEFIELDGYIVTGGTGGTLALWWAQNTSNATASSLEIGSSITLEKDNR